MEIADLVCVNKYDDNYKRVCMRLKRQIEGALSLSMSKHMYFDANSKPDGSWFCPVELMSAKRNENVESIWKHAEDFKSTVG